MAFQLLIRFFSVHVEGGGLFAPTNLEEPVDAEAAIVSSTAIALFSSVFGGFTGPTIKSGSLSVESGQVVLVGALPSVLFSGDHSQA